MWAFNNVSLDSRDFKNLERTELWAMVDDFMRRFGKEI